MAYAALTSLAGVIHQILPQDQRYISLCGKDQMESLHEKVSLLQDFLEYASLRSFSPDIDVLESRIRDTAYKMEDTIELVILTEPGKESESELQLPTPDEFSSYFEEFSILLEEGMEMKKTLDNNVIPLSLHPTSSREAPSSKGTKVGLEKALNQILEKVIGQESMLRIVPITGMGGIGKTTLARASYEAPHTLHHFDVRFWVTVSQEYNIQDILRGFLPEAEQTKYRDERLIEYVHKHLKGRRYLIALDDMWDEKVWDHVRIAFPDDNNGSRVILTTRLSGVASYVGSSSYVHEMQFLSEDQSWELLRGNVYGQKSCSNEFEGIGRMIATNCKGLPLAIVVIAGLLKFNKTKDYWEQVAQSTGEKVTTSNNHLLEILSWSYTRLPLYLKACFLYMGSFKEDYEIPTKVLVRLWAAERFLKPKQSKSMEKVAEECLEELVDRSLVLVTKRWYNGKIKSCSVHDVLREVSIRKAEEEKFHYHFTPYVDESTFRNVLAVQRRVSITNCTTVKFPLDMFGVTTRSLIDQGKFHSESISTIHSFKLLRVLNKTRIEEDYMLSILCKLANLRYLHFDCIQRNLINVPESISELQNLETLIVGPQRRTIRLVFPLEIWKMQSLKHIVMNGRGNFVPVPKQGDHVLSNLQTLAGVININFTTPKNFAEKVPNLKKLKYMVDRPEVAMENFQYLHQVEELSVRRDFYLRPTNYVFPLNLKRLSLYRTSIPLHNLSPIGLLSNLKVLKLKNNSVEGEEWEPNEGEFLQLEHLKMEELKIRHWRVENIHYPSLRKLVILKCRWLKEVPESIGEIDTLETLTVRHISEEAKRSVQRIQEIQQETGNHLLQVNIVLKSSRTQGSIR